jgi:hypothetical protein
MRTASLFLLSLVLPRPAAAAADESLAPAVVVPAAPSLPAAGTELYFESDGPGVLVSPLRGPHYGDPTAPAGSPGSASCVTPCRMLVPNGEYVFAAGGRSFSVRAFGGSDAYRISPESPMLESSGWAMVVSGIVLGVLGGAFIYLDDDAAVSLLTDPENDWGVWGWTTLISGAVMLGTGIGLVASSGGTVERLGRDAFGASAPSPVVARLRLGPTLAPGGRGGGLSLALVF